MKKAQVWVETVIYILIGLTIIAVLLAIINPKINQMKDKAVIESMISGLETIDKDINGVKLAYGKKEIVDIGLKKGRLIINGETEEIVFVLDESKVEYSEPGREIERGSLYVLTEKQKGIINVSLSLKYDSLNITYSEKDEKKVFNQASLPYRFAIENKGDQEVMIGGETGKLTNIDIYSIS